MTLPRGCSLGPYEIEALIGAGGMGEVYRARDRRLDRLVAIKVLDDPFNSPERRQRFEREGAAIARLVHPHICRLYDVGAQDDISYLVMEYLDGVTLAHRIAESHPLPVRDALAIAAQVVDAVQAAHSVGLVHRDLKPGNIMLTSEGVKLLDFGLVRFLGEADDRETRAAASSSLTGEGDIVGTIQYMSPEQVQGQPADARSDIFALGAIIYEVFAGRSPFSRINSMATVAAIIGDEPNPLRAARPDAPLAVARAVARCLEKDPGQRWPDAAALAAALSRPVRRVRNGAGRHTALRPGVQPRARHIRRIAVVPLRNLSAHAEDEYIADGVTEAVISGLGEIPGLEVISRTSANRFAAAGADLPAMTRAVRADAFVEGAVMIAGDRIRVSLRLVDVTSESQVWSATYDRSRADLFDIHSEIASGIAAHIQVKVKSSDRRRAPKRQANPAAYDAYLRARFLLSQRSLDTLKISFKHLMNALEIDPDYALVHAGLADWYLSAAIARMMPSSEGMPKAHAAASRAIELDPLMPEAHSALGRVALYEWRFADARRELEAALRLNSNLASAEQWLSRLLTYTHEFESAIAHSRIALRLDPLSALVHVNVASTFYAARAFDDAIAEAQRSLEFAPEFGIAVYFIGICEHFRGNHEASLRELARARAISPGHPSPVVATAFVLAQIGRRPEAMALLNELKERATRANVSPFDFAEVYSGLGETDLAIEHLQRSRDLHEPELLGIGIDPIFDPVRHDPRFRELLVDIGLAS